MNFRKNMSFYKNSLLLGILFFLFVSCQPQKNMETGNNNNHPKITIEELEKLNPTVISTKDGNISTYSVIIYTKDAESLKKDGILVQSISKNFVTALIKKEDLDLIYRNKYVESIAIPQIEHLNQGDELH